MGEEENKTKAANMECKPHIMRGDIKWDGRDDDYVAKAGQYRLRVEKMNKHEWWWCVYLDDEIIDDSHHAHPVATTELEAKLLAESAYIWHRA